MNTAPLSAIIPSYNLGHFVTEAVESILVQTVVPQEIIVIDDGSKDDTAQRLAPYAGRIRYIHQTNQGVSAARNHGIRVATHDIVAFLDADDVWHPRKVEIQFPLFERHPELGLLSGHSIPWPASPFPALDDARARVLPVSWAQLVMRNPLATSTILARRSVIKQVGGFDHQIQGPEDRDLWLRMAEVAPVALVDLPLSGYRDVPGSLSKQADRCRQGMLNILEKVGHRGRWRGRQLLRRKAYSFLYHSCAYTYAADGCYARALLCSLKSLAWYPLPYGSSDVPVFAERPRRALANALRWLRMRSAPRLSH